MMSTLHAQVWSCMRAALLYALCTALGLQLSRFDHGIAVVWFAGAVLFVELVVAPRRRWPGLLLSVVPSSVLTIAWLGMGIRLALPLTVIGLAEAWGAARLLKRIYPRFGRLQSVDEAMRFLVVAGAIVPALGGLAAALVVHAAGGMPFPIVWRDWFAGHALGYVVFSPPLLLAYRGEAAKWLRTASFAERREAALLAAAVVAMSLAAFAQSTVPLVLLPLIPMVAATLRLGRFGAMVSVVILMVIGLTCSFAGLGPTTLLHVGMALKFEVVQIYFGCVVLVMLPLSAELTARQRLLERVRAAEALHRLIVERSSDVIMRLRADGTVRFASPSVARLWGYLPEDMVGRSVYDIVHPRDAPAVRANRHAILQSADAPGVMEYRTVGKDGRELWVEANTRAVHDHQGRITGTITVMRDVTERRAMVSDLARQAATDPLTGLANRRVFDGELVRCLTSGQPSCLALFDLDHFKRINDTHGHAAGDRILQIFARVLRDSLRTGDLAVRLGGEEFAALMFGATPDDARLVCERILRRFADASDEETHATVSAGLARISAGTSPEAAMTAADTALYQAKSAGRNRLSIAA